MSQAVAWNQRIDEVRAIGYDAAFVTYDSVAALGRFARRRKIGFTLLSDPDSTVIRAVGLLDDQYSPGNLAHGVAHPMILVVDAEGIVRHRFSKAGYWSRPPIDMVLEALRR